MQNEVMSYLAQQRRMIVSVFPIEMKAHMRHNGFTEYVLPAAPKGGFSKVYVMRSLHPGTPPQKLDGVSGVVDFGMNFADEPASPIARPVDVSVVVADLLYRWQASTLGSTAEAGPGIALIAGDEPTTDELDALTARQTQYFRNLVYEADIHFADKAVGKISDLHRAAASWLGAEDREWVKEISPKAQKQCPACDSRISAAATKCMHCSEDLIARAIKYGITKDEDPVVWERVQALTAPTPAKKGA